MFVVAPAGAECTTDDGRDSSGGRCSRGHLMRMLRGPGHDFIRICTGVEGGRDAGVARTLNEAAEERGGVKKGDGIAIECRVVF